MSSVNIHVHEVTRVEGHGDIVVNAKNGKLEECRFEVTEAPRFFEAMARGRRWDEMSHLTSRICGICAIGHANASLNATEDAFGITPSKQTIMLRKLNFHAETLQSHILHVYFLVAPDFFGAGSVIPLAASHPAVVLRALRLKKMGNDMADALCGRKVHPISMAVNGWTRIPTKKELLKIKQMLKDREEDILETVKLIATLKVPNFQRQTEYVSLTSKDSEYPWIAGDIKASDTGTFKVQDYKKVTNERIVKHSTAKHTGCSRTSYMVGALARVNNNYAKLNGTAKDVAAQLGLKVPCHNPFMISIAQVVETAHCYVDSFRVIDELLDMSLKDEEVVVKPKAGRGAGSCDVPRGILFHDYTYDDQGRIKDANLIIPTGQNYSNIEDDMRALVPQIIDKPKEEIRQTLEMLVRAYDPCISCSVHMLNVRFV
ncbi:MAG: Ni/Fe hydrogenase subunit alpha [Planctomycetes bacterium]|nr:Ni/Fe hydrogenase subunit alpha [Planctomycetota bacterium]